MAGLSEDDSAQLQSHLQHAVISCSERCLYNSAKWAAELLNSLPTPSSNTSNADPFSSPPPPSTADSHDSSTAPPPPSTTPYPRPLPPSDPTQARLEAREANRFLLAKSFFDCREFDRCSAVFLPELVPRGPLPAASVPAAKPPGVRPAGLSMKALFLALYAKFLAGEKRKEEDSEIVLGPMDGGVAKNREVPTITKILQDWFEERHGSGLAGDGWLEFLYGIMLARSKDEDMAREWLVLSVHLNPWNWAAWLEIAGLLSNRCKQLNRLTEHLPQNIMTFIFHVYASQEFFQCTDQVHNSLTQIGAIFPGSAFLQTQRALLYYHSKDFEEAEAIFNGLLVADPHRLDHLDAYSNILYVMESRPKLAFLAHLATRVDKFRPETCIAVGNYYSLKSEHEKAVLYFRRALTLDRNFLSAWTLMGHEYVEMKNTHAAIESYRRAVDINRADYRAWYGLGQAYEMLDMHLYALFYYQRAAVLRPYDPKMWFALANCYAAVGRADNAIRAYKRALVAGSYSQTSGGAAPAAGSAMDGLTPGMLGILDPDALYQMGLLYEKLQRPAECAAYMRLCIAQEEGPSEADQGGAVGVGVTSSTSKARMWLARWEFLRGEWQAAMELANELCQDGVEVEDAKALVRDVRARIAMQEGRLG
ncbi:anaphase promoting complex subunit 8 [Lineolata rhizophorae]|uniref:Anaphase promoting complex subunit 8 n=1 Tax=Lineolata rhizophorae TaxID=578093 RepID=A0A6A6NVH4_9PEZI|nr:anaphase promoting complex subunit 8 [Lineolata rhizophorae]